jgi:Domain of unknown function (DUF1413)
MPTIKTTVDDRVYDRLVRERRREGVPSVSALFLKRCGVLTDVKEASEIVKRGLKIAKRKGSGYEFRLRDLFPARQWGRWTKGARLRAGRMFHEKVGAARDGIRTSRKSASGHQYYVVA